MPHKLTMNVDHQLASAGLDGEGNALPGTNWQNMANNVSSTDQEYIKQIGRPFNHIIRKRRRKSEAKILQGNRLKFIPNWITAFNSGSPKVMEHFMLHWVKQNVVFREQFVHYLPQSLLYREIHSSRLLYQYLMTILRAIPDAMYLENHQTLKTKRDGSAYVIATIRIVGHFSFRLLTTNATSQVSQFLTQANPLRAVLNNDHLLNRTHFKTFLRNQNRREQSSLYVSSFPAVYHKYPVEYDVYNGVLLPKGDKRLAPPLRLANHFDDAKMVSLLAAPQSNVRENEAVPYADDFGFLDNEEAFEEMFTELMAAEDEEDMGSDFELEDNDGSLHVSKRFSLDLDPSVNNKIGDYSSQDSLGSTSSKEEKNPSESSTTAQSSASSLVSLRYQQVEQRPSQFQHMGQPQLLNQAQVPSRSPIIFPIAPTLSNSERECLLAQQTAIEEQQMATNVIRAALTMVPAVKEIAPSMSSSVSRNTSRTFLSSANSTSGSSTNTTEPDQHESASDSGSISSSSPSPLLSPNPPPPPPLTSPLPCISDLIKVSTPFTQFFALEELPFHIPVDASQTFVAYFEAGSDQVHRIDVFKKLAQFSKK